jgi:fructosamine-3-kinase
VSQRDALLAAVSAHVGGPVHVDGLLGGAAPVRVSTAVGPKRQRFVLKWSEAGPSAALVAEARGLDLLREAGGVRVPQVLAAEPSFILMELIPSGRAAPNFGEVLGRGLAALHRVAAPQFGLDHDNTCGATVQVNHPRSSWVEFYRDCRLAPQVKLLGEKNAGTPRLFALLDAVMDRLDAWLPNDCMASLVHGDLWGGNCLVDARGGPVLIDPAVYFGHREGDLAMMELFGGFDARVFRAYAEAWPLDPGARERRPLYQLYHLLNHANLFGGEYLARVEQVAARFAG